MLKALLLLATLQLCCALKILVVFPIPGGSHAILGEGYVRHLLGAGHEVTYITPLPRLKPSPNLRQIDVSANYKMSPMNAFLDLEKLMKKEIDLTNMSALKEIMVNIANATITNPNVKEIMDDPAEKFDVVIVEWLYTEIYSGFASVFGSPLIWSSSMDPHSLVLRLIDEMPNPAYTPDNIDSENPPFNFMQRINSLWMMMDRIIMIWSTSAKDSSIYNAGFGPSAVKRGQKLAPLAEVMFSGSLMLGNSHVSLGQPIKLPQNYKPILGYHIPSQIEPLPENTQKIMDNAQHGIIYFSMGSMLQSQTLPSKLKKDLLIMFGGLRQTVLWKFEEELSDLPRNVHIVQWAPQHSILAHSKCVLFITHGGLLSLTETVHFGVPVIGVPMFADQFQNVDRVVKKGFAQKVSLDWDFVTNLKVAIEDMVHDPRYRKSVKEVSFIYHHRPVGPGAELVHWVEHVARTRGAPHLRSPALDVPAYQKYYLDLVALIIAFYYILKIGIKRIFKKKKTMENKQKKN